MRQSTYGNLFITLQTEQKMKNQSNNLIKYKL